MLKPSKLGGKFKIRSFEDINALKMNYPKEFKAIMGHKCFSYLASLGVAIAILGIFIPWLNVITTRHQLKKETAHKNAKLLKNA